jgi:hypothetical protein
MGNRITLLLLGLVFSGCASGISEERYQEWSKQMNQLRLEAMACETSADFLVQMQYARASKQPGPQLPAGPSLPVTSEWAEVYQAFAIATAAGNLAYLGNDEAALEQLDAALRDLVEKTKGASIKALGRIIQTGEDSAEGEENVPR